MVCRSSEARDDFLGGLVKHLGKEYENESSMDEARGGVQLFQLGLDNNFSYQLFSFAFINF